MAIPALEKTLLEKALYFLLGRSVQKYADAQKSKPILSENGWSGGLELPTPNAAELGEPAPSGEGPPTEQKKQA